MNRLRELYASDPAAREVILEFQQINDLSPLLFLLQRFTSMEKLSLHGNRLRQLPHDLYILQTIKQLDISNNMFVSSDVVEEALSTLPNLKILTTNVKSKQDQQRIAKRLPNLQLLNGQLIRRQMSTKKQRIQGVSALSQQDLQIVAGVFDQVRQLFRRGDYNLDKQLASQFDQNVENVIHDLTKRISNQTPSAVMQGRIQCAKYALLDLCFIRAIDYVQNSDPIVGKLLIKIHDMHADVFKQIANLVLNKNANQRPYDDLPKKQKQYLEQIEVLKKQRGNLYDEINQLQLQNAKYLQIITAFGLKGSNNTVSKSRLQVFNGKSAQKGSTQLLPAYVNSKSPSKGTLRSGSAKSQKELVSSQSFKNLKNLSLNQTIQLMTEIMNSKFQQNQKDQAQHNQIQTLQHHMYSYFNKKYGLKNLTVQWAMSLVNAIKNYHQNPTVGLFGRILRNQVEQQFWLDQQDIIRQIDDLLKLVIKEKSNRLDHEIQQILFKRKAGVIYLQQCNVILQSLFSQQDVGIMMDTLTTQSEYQQKSSNKYDLTPKKSSLKVVKYQIFINLVLQRNLINYQKRSQKFLKQFRKLDTDNDGMLNQNQTITLIKRLLPKDSDQLDRLLKSFSFRSSQLLSFSIICSKFFNK